MPLRYTPLHCAVLLYSLCTLIALGTASYTTMGGDHAPPNNSFFHDFPVAFFLSFLSGLQAHCNLNWRMMKFHSPTGLFDTRLIKQLHSTPPLGGLPQHQTALHAMQLPALKCCIVHVTSFDTGNFNNCCCAAMRLVSNKTHTYSSKCSFQYYVVCACICVSC